MEMQPIVTDMVTVHRVAESNTAGWPSTLIRVIHVGVEISGLGAEGSDMRIPC
jgi:receptor-type tyrosine-protein phosphatase V